MCGGGIGRHSQNLLGFFILPNPLRKAVVGYLKAFMRGANPRPHIFINLSKKKQDIASLIKNLICIHLFKKI